MQGTTALGSTAFSEGLTPETLFRGAAELSDPETRDRFEEFASTLIDIQALPVFEGAR